MTAPTTVPGWMRPTVRHAKERATIVTFDGRIGTLLHCPARGRGTNVTVLIDGRHYRVPRSQVAVLASPTQETP